MMYERRSSRHPDRRTQCGGRRRPSESDSHKTDPITSPLTSAAPSQAGAEAEAGRDQSAHTREELVQSRESSAHMRESAVVAREEQAHVREDVAHGRETSALLREELATSREQVIHNVQNWRDTQAEHGAKLRLANEQLVIASVQSQIRAEEIEKSKEAMAHLASHDFLTNLPNRVQLHDRITQAIAYANRHSMKLAILFLDLDRFKAVNDTLGHAVGDQLLQAVAQRLKSTIRGSDTVSRHGGDEFILVMSEVNDLAALAVNVKKIHDIVTAPYLVAGHDLEVGATIGISVFPENGKDADTLIRNADAAMYEAKNSGRNHFQFFRQEMRIRDAERRLLESSLFRALDQQQFVLFYQAQIDLESGTISGAEALLRWEHPDKGLLLPASFIGTAEDCGAIVPMGRWALHEACTQAQAWLDAGLPFHVMSVNISALEFENEDFVKNVRSVLQETGLAPLHLELELTETVLMKSIESTVLILNELRLMGVRIAIDDFGTGYSSLSYLKQLPVDTMKIDQSFIRDISDDSDQILINAVVGLGKSLRHHVVVEGVETSQQIAFLRQHDCPTVQGFYLHVPMAADEFAIVLAQGVPPHQLN